jgi:hypothetical protein
VSEIVASGDGQAVVEYQLLVRESLPYFIKEGILNHISSVLADFVDRPAQYEHKFRIQSPDFVDKVLRQANSKLLPKLRFRFGIGTPGNARFQTWQDHYITGYSASVEGVAESSGHFVSIHTSDALYVLRETQTKTVARRGRISDIVAQIASENGIQDTVIEQTGDNRYLLIQSFLSDEEFIRQRCVPRAVNAKGRGNYCFYIRDNVLHFHSADYESTVKELNFFRPENMSLVEHDRSHELFGQGASGLRIVQYNPLTGLSREVVNDPEKSLRYSNMLYPISTLTNSHLIMHHTVGANPPDEAVALAQNFYDQARNQIFRTNLEGVKIVIAAGDLLKLNVESKLSSASSWSGYYWVVASTHTIVKQAITSEYILQRGESTNYLGDQVYVSDPEGQLTSETEAPGQDLNVADAVSSPLTKGAGAATGGARFITLKDPKTG